MRNVIAQTYMYMSVNNAEGVWTVHPTPVLAINTTCAYFSKVAGVRLRRVFRGKFKVHDLCYPAAS